MINKF